MPRGKKKVEVSEPNTQQIAAQIGEAIIASENGDVQNQKAADEILHDVDAIAGEIKSMHSRIASTTLEIGLKFYNIKKILDAAPAQTRAFGVKTFTNWMNTVAPELCGRSDRAAWHYYRSYTESLASGLQEKTIIALAPSLLKSEKPRRAVLAAVRQNPELATMLNEAARSPRQIQALAKSEPVIAVLEKARKLDQLQPAAPRERIAKAIVSALRLSFPKNPAQFDLNAANAALSDLVYAVREALGQLGLSAFVPVGYVKMTQEDASRMYGSTEPAKPSSKDVVNAASIGASKALEGATKAVAAAA